jgi:hypothetical protein
MAKGSYAQGRGQKGFYCYVVIWAVKESPNLYGYSYTKLRSIVVLWQSWGSESNLFECNSVLVRRIEAIESGYCNHW